MPDANAAGLKRPPAPIHTSLDPSSLVVSKLSAFNNASAASKATRTAQTGPQRVDIEPLYASLKASIESHWAEYKQAIGLFTLGSLNQNELSLRIDHFILTSPEIEHQHNSLLTAILANIYREAPDVGVAPWVASNDKPIAGMGAGSMIKGGNKVEERLRKEIMLLPGKDRRRLKGVIERDSIEVSAATSAMVDYRLARNIKLSDTVPVSAGGLNKTNWDLEIRKRYATPLSHEILEFPDVTHIQDRLMPICYEEALPNGCAQNCAELMTIATELYLKDAIAAVFAISRNSSIDNKPRPISLISHSVQGGKKLVHGVDDPVERSVLQNSNSLSVGATSGLRSTLNSLPFQKRPLGISDFRVALSLNSCSLGSMPDVRHDIETGWPEGVLEGWDGSLISASNRRGCQLLPSLELTADLQLPMLEHSGQRQTTGGLRPVTAPLMSSVYRKISNGILTPQSSAGSTHLQSSLPVSSSDYSNPTTRKAHRKSDLWHHIGASNGPASAATASPHMRSLSHLNASNTSPHPSHNGITALENTSDTIPPTDATLSSSSSSTSSMASPGQIFNAAGNHGIFSFLNDSPTKLQNTFSLAPASLEHGVSPMILDDTTSAPNGWHGSSAEDCNSLFGILDDCLAIGGG